MGIILDLSEVILILGVKCLQMCFCLKLIQSLQVVLLLLTYPVDKETVNQFTSKYLK